MPVATYTNTRRTTARARAHPRPTPLKVLLLLQTGVGLHALGRLDHHPLEPLCLAPTHVCAHHQLRAVLLAKRHAASLLIATQLRVTWRGPGSRGSAVPTVCSHASCRCPGRVSRGC